MTFTARTLGDVAYAALGGAVLWVDGLKFGISPLSKAKEQPFISQIKDCPLA